MKVKIITFSTIILFALGIVSCTTNSSKSKNTEPVVIDFSQPRVAEQANDASDALQKSEKLVVEKDSVYRFVEIQPAFNGGLEVMLDFISTNIHYPEDAKIQQLSGDVICQFVVEQDGSITNIEIRKGISQSLDAEAIRVIQLMPKWNPGKLSGETVRTMYSLPIKFKLE